MGSLLVGVVGCHRMRHVSSEIVGGAPGAAACTGENRERPAQRVRAGCLVFDAAAHTRETCTKKLGHSASSQSAHLSRIEVE